ncbi:hypothetical protein [Wenzhouxiangella marina]|uniref:Uncharacterized protein n=1 Tax=Wenzhouxiangella marina TaxID=1579979 RepID=A0A0K0XVA2_9GAMM|nr:hypothetical protein [Wenzhouxiangella marina]AKS41546.1 hypothetical protein WM2015_1172 [Wenzhouxiangella marina]MBB6086695.1 hypothetical protein [Wenzhouxiangella marina]
MSLLIPHLHALRECRLVARYDRFVADAGVRFRAIRVDPRPEGYRFDGTLTVDLADYDPAGPALYRSRLDAWSGWKRRGPVRPDPQGSDG